MAKFTMIEFHLSKGDGCFYVDSLDGGECSELEAGGANGRTTWPEAVSYLLSCGWEPYSCIHVPGSEYPIRHYFRKRVES